MNNLQRLSLSIIFLIALCGSMIHPTITSMAQELAVAAPAPKSWLLAGSDPNLTRRGSAAAYDANRQVTVMFGGFDDQDNPDNETWEFDGVSWHQATPPHSPPTRYWHGMAYDSSRKVVVVFGGNNGLGSSLNDTWEYNGTDWTQVQTLHAPTHRQGFGMTYDSCRQRVVVYGGGDYPKGTWEYNGVDWQETLTSANPGSLYLPAMAFDSARCQTVLFGGDGGGSQGVNGTWEYDGVNWAHINPANSPSPRWGHALTFDPMTQKIVLFGGYGPSYPSGIHHGDTWEYDDANWAETSPAYSPTPREQHMMVFQGNRKTIMLHGGFGSGETWLYGSGYPVSLPIVMRDAYICSDRPQMIDPAYGAKLNTLIPVYTWDTCDLPGATGINLEVALNPDMSGHAMGLSTIVTSGIDSFQDMENLASATRYYWRLQVSYGSMEGKYSEGTFETSSAGLVLPPPALISPADYSTIPSMSVTFQWQSVPQASQYILEWGPVGGNYYYRAWVYGTQYTDSHLDPNQLYYWRVFTVSDYAIGDPSGERYFTSGSFLDNQPPLVNAACETASYIADQFNRATACPETSQATTGLDDLPGLRRVYLNTHQ